MVLCEAGSPLSITLHLPSHSRRINQINGCRTLSATILPIELRDFEGARRGKRWRGSLYCSSWQGWMAAVHKPYSPLRLDLHEFGSRGGPRGMSLVPRFFRLLMMVSDRHFLTMGLSQAMDDGLTSTRH
ncbi:unnamed protein product [Fusarium venenatum]|uniref:Uncharacterized protein n=1 Tax=Fusarium venenatum TaxID=56646 RepID=A0A2L2TLV9_9HYPO|nr:uncharacterized protein FVRRES_00718 [Fusarium venenatum]CEI64206.1 unnamed protein product [Fusarium venenatum]